MENKFIKVLSIDKNCCDSVCIVNKDSIDYFETTNFYEEEYSCASLFLKNGTEIIVQEEGIEDIQNSLLGKTIKRKIKRKVQNINEIESIDEYLNCNRNWDKSIGLGNRINILHNLTSSYKEEIATKIKLMKYQDFLKTPYWKAISTYMKIKQNKCEICGSKIELHTHHKTYENHGYEILHLNDLQVVCGVCHNNIHKENK